MTRFEELTLTFSAITIAITVAASVYFIGSLNERVNILVKEKEDFDQQKIELISQINNLINEKLGVVSEYETRIALLENVANEELPEVRKDLVFLVQQTRGTNGHKTMVCMEEKYFVPKVNYKKSCRVGS
ncbi:hypothetical protein EXT47_19395 [Pseudoalteromonas sp. CO342X]|uniref:hypothetical protein n=1 Tax=Pseudoalteromonas sp. CO342X TaxID=1777270 RepID=UPI001023EB60|nr:hypothetical protein [Pseudoalteromonas sp. CO342X]RZG12481.1 hypothetical protein EXT47_19395 [Pseudoalteromonas sp. CO342X]